MPALILRWLAPYIMKGVAIAGALLGLWFYILHVESAARSAQKAADAAVVREATLRADNAALASARAQEAAHDQATKEANDALLPQLADYRGRVDAYVARMRGQAAQGGAVATGLPSTADAAGIADGSGGDTVIPVAAADLDICAVNTARLINAQQWATKLESVP